MNITFSTATIKPMIDWLQNRKKNGVKDEKQLREILKMDDYNVEFRRYASEGLPVCGINFEEAVDFFMHFDEKDFENIRLQYKKESFMAFYENIEERIKKLELITSISEEDCQLIEKLVQNGIPDECTEDIQGFKIILAVSIGNSMGWPYEDYIDYDIAQLEAFESIEDFLHVTAHEINHIFVAGLLAPEGIKGEEFFLQNFAYEGLAVHYNNNLATKYKKAKYEGKVFAMQEKDMKFYEENFDKIFDMIRADYNASKGKTLEEVAALVSDHYEKFEFMGKNVMQYPTYYFGCYMWGLVDMNFGKEKLYEAIKNPHMFVELYNSVAEDKYKL